MYQELQNVINLTFLEIKLLEIFLSTEKDLTIFGFVKIGDIHQIRR